MVDRETERKTSIATFCAGSFWDAEAAFRHISGVVATSVGFMGGTVPDPTYEMVGAGKTGHSEVVMIAYDPGRISYRDLLGIFFSSHDPCGRKQGEYEGPQYEPVIFYHSGPDKQLAEEHIGKLQQTGCCPEEIVTRTKPASTFYRAEECHQQFYEKMGCCYPVLYTGDPDRIE